VRRGARADRPMAVVATERPDEGGVIPFPTR
jgi:hypothetical protein